MESRADKKRRQTRERMRKMRSKRKALEEAKKQSYWTSSSSDDVHEVEEDSDVQLEEAHANVARNEPVLDETGPHGDEQQQGQEGQELRRERSDTLPPAWYVSDTNRSDNVACSGPVLSQDTEETEETHATGEEEAIPEEYESDPNGSQIVASNSQDGSSEAEEWRTTDTEDGESDGARSEYLSHTNGSSIVTKTGVDDIVRKLARICFSHDISDGALEDLFRFFCKNAGDISSLLDSRQLRPSWKNFVRPRALKSCPKVKCSYVVERAFGGEISILQECDLDTIPREILSLPHDGPRRLLRTEAYVRLSDIKFHHRQLHQQMGLPPEETARQLLNAHISADGVRESQKGTRSLIILSVRLGYCIYLYSAINPLIGVPSSRPTPTELLGCEI